MHLGVHQVRERDLGVAHADEDHLYEDLTMLS